MYTIPIESKMEVFARTYSEDTGVNVEIGPAFATDGKKIFVLPISDQADEWVRFMTEVGVYHETGHIITKDAPTFQSIKDKTKRNIFNVLRDIAIEKEMCKRYPGMNRKWVRFLSEFIKKNTNAELAHPSIMPFAKLMKILYLNGREKHLGKDLGLIVPKDLQEIFQKRLEPLMDEIVKHETITETLALTEKVYTALKEKDDKPEQSQGSGSKSDSKQQSNKDDQEHSKGSQKEDPSESQVPEENDQNEKDNSAQDGNGEDNPEGENSDETSNSSGEGSDQDGSESESSSGQSGNSDMYNPEEPEGTETGSPNGSNAPLSKEAKEALKEVQDSIKDGTADTQTIGDQIKTAVNIYADTHKVYREKAGLKDNIRPAGYGVGQKDYLEAGQKLTGYTGTRLRTLLISERAPHWVSNCQTGRLDTRKLWKVRNGSTEVFRRKTEAVYEDAAVSMVIDNTGSMDERNGNTTKVQVAMSLVNVLAYELDKLRVPFEAVNFTNSSSVNNMEGIRDVPVNINILKSFEEPFRRAMNRFGNPCPSGGTIEFPAIVYGARRLAMRKETKKVLFLITDGGTASGNGIMDAAMRTAMKEFLARIQKAGMKVVGIGLFDKALQDYCPDFMHVTDLAKFPSEFYSKLTKILL